MVAPVAAIALIEHEGRILSVWNRRYQGWGLPGGKAEEGESIRDALARELLEETALVLVSAEPIYAAPTESSDSGRQVYVFRVRVSQLPVSTPYACEDNSDVDWKTPDELLQTSPFKSFYVKMFAALRGLNQEPVQ